VDLLVIGSSVAFVSYILASVATVSRLFHPKGPNIVLVLSLGCVAIVAHTLSNGQYLYQQADINFSLPNVVSLVSLLITLLVSLVALKYKVNLLLPVVYSFAGIWQLLMIFIPPNVLIPLSAEKVFLVTHITLALIAYCVLIIATLYAFQVAYINYKLKNKNLLAVSHLPPLMQVENQLFLILSIGTLCLLLSQFSGLIFLDDFFTKERAHKTVLSLMSLLVYMLILWGHFKQGWRGHKVLVLTVIASLLLTLSYFGSRFVKEFIL
jgi:ABC-type uncharacterized transport system permease subunit|tara:strand:- start:3314 stop:4111 length:798 start_codon:yes stop_codon:yes gene_type:complete